MELLCAASEHDYLGDGTVIREEELEIGREYTFVKGESMPYGLLVHLEELPCKYGYQSYLFEELQSYDEKILEENYHEWLVKNLMKLKRQEMKDKFIPGKSFKQY